VTVIVIKWYYLVEITGKTVVLVIYGLVQLRFSKYLFFFLKYNKLFVIACNLGYDGPETANLLW